MGGHLISHIATVQVLAVFFTHFWKGSVHFQTGGTVHNCMSAEVLKYVMHYMKCINQMVKNFHFNVRKIFKVNLHIGPSNTCLILSRCKVVIVHVLAHGLMIPEYFHPLDNMCIS